MKAWLRGVRQRRRAVWLGEYQVAAGQSDAQHLPINLLAFPVNPGRQDWRWAQVHESAALLGLGLLEHDPSLSEPVHYLDD